MQRIFTSEDRFRVFQIKVLLENAGIPCFVKNEFAAGAAGDLSPFDCWPEVWLTDNEWEPRAQRLIKEFEQQPLPDNWFCPSCKNENEGSFEICWQCGADPDTA